MHAQLRELARLHAGRDPTPSAASIDSQSVKTLMGGIRGFAGGKQIAGRPAARKRHILVDTQGFLRVVVVHPATIPGRQDGRLVLEALAGAVPRLRRIWADQGYTGALIPWMAQEHGVTLEVVYPRFRQFHRSAPDLAAALGDTAGFHVIPKRWIVERTFSWLGRQRRLSKDDECLASSTEALMYLVYLVGIRLLLARLSRN